VSLCFDSLDKTSHAQEIVKPDRFLNVYVKLIFFFLKKAFLLGAHKIVLRHRFDSVGIVVIIKVLLFVMSKSKEKTIIQFGTFCTFPLFRPSARKSYGKLKNCTSDKYPYSARRAVTDL
jgi:hypothetical protein